MIELGDFFKKIISFFIHEVSLLYLENSFLNVCVVNMFKRNCVKFSKNQSNIDKKEHILSKNIFYLLTHKECAESSCFIDADQCKSRNK